MDQQGFVYVYEYAELEQRTLQCQPIKFSSK